MICENCNAVLADDARWCLHCDTPVGDRGQTSFEDDDSVYEAFISYRHLERDAKAAKRIQRFVEGYRLPKQLRKKVGRDRLGKCFRDSDELPTGAGLSQSIQEALERSRFLVVICSPEMRESQWVAREVETFASLHGRDRIMLALIAGEPDESFPEVLLTKHVRQESGEIIDVDTEPVAADFREGAPGSFRDEALRIVASIAGCGYDDLRQRARARRTKAALSIASAVAVVAVTFSGFSLYQQTQISANLEQALRNQSEYLATESDQLYEQGDRMQAIQVALAALPGNEGDALTGGDRPYVPSAQQALEQALGIYPHTNIEHWESVYSHYEEADITDWAVSEDSAQYATVDNLGNLVVRDVSSGSTVAYANVQGYFGDCDYLRLCFAGSQILLYDHGKDELYGFDMDTQNVRQFAALSNCENENAYAGKSSFLIDDILVLGDDGTIVAVEYPAVKTYAGGAVCFLDAATGEVQSPVALPDLRADTDITYDTSLVTATSDESKVVISSYDSVAVIDVASRQVIKTEVDGRRITSCYAAGNALLLATIESVDGQEAKDVTFCLECLKLDTLETVWTFREGLNSTSYFSEAGMSYLDPCIASVETVGDKELAFAVFSQKVVALDVADGSSVLSLEAESPYREIFVIPSSQENACNVLALTHQGYLSNTRVKGDENSSDAGSLYDCLTGEEGADAAFFEKDGEYLCLIVSHEQDERTVLYRYGADDPAGAQRVPALDDATSLVQSSAGTYLAESAVYASSSTGSSADNVSVIDTTDFSVAADLPLSDFNGESLDLFFSEERDELLYAVDTIGDALFAVNAQTGDVCGRYEVADSMYSIAGRNTLLDSSSKCITSDAEHVGVVVERSGSAARFITLDPETLEEKSCIDLAWDGERASYVEEVAETDSLLLVAVRSQANDADILDDAYEYSIRAYNKKTGELLTRDISACEIAQPGAFGALAVCPDSSQVLVACSDNTLRAFDAEGAMTWERSFSSGGDWFACWLESGSLFMQDATSQCRLLSTRDGMDLSGATVSVSFPIKRAFEAQDKLYAYTSSGLVYLVDAMAVIHTKPDGFGLSSSINTAQALSRDSTTALCSYDGAWAVPVWSLDDEITYAEELVSGHELTDDERSLYHIDQ